ncbi:MAG: aminoglycoside phosphotransferase family protein [Chloroflexota bacterium]|nr:aminoglycoside phosphotransferase family protein [Chloroflexota bacterium]
MRPEPNFIEVVPNFSFGGQFMYAEPYGFGHINDTYAAYFRKADGTEHRYIMQRINHEVFKHPEELMANIEAITTHLRRKIAAAGGNPDRETLTLIPTTEGDSFYRTDNGYYWRAYIFIENALTYQIPESLDHIYNAARAYGNFQQLLDDFPVDQLYETIPYFHHTAKRFETFLKVVDEDKHNRAQEVKNEIDFVLQRADETSVVVNLIEKGELPVRVTHNDTKYNNVMIDDDSGEGVCVIDLDTVMPGSSLYDFGDAIRSITNTAEEDEPDLSKVHFSLETFERYTLGYLEATCDALTPAEIEHMAFSARLMTFECGMRFLTDHLNGDVYYKIQRKNHNLDRCRTQFKLVNDMERDHEKMENIVERYRC